MSDKSTKENKRSENLQENPDFSRPRRRSCSFDYRAPHQRKGKDAGIRFKTSFRNTIYDVMKKRGWKQTDSDLDWDFHWAEREWMFEYYDQVHLEPWQRVNHYRNDRELCRKDLLIKNVKRKKRALEREKLYEEAAKYAFCPSTYVLPGDYALFVEEFKKSPNQAWIMKPTGKSQGKGIFIVTKLKEISKWKSEHRWKPDNVEVESYVVQRYVSNPYLVGGKKFDMRLYALVTSFSPLTVYMHRSGFARFSTVRYSHNMSDIGNNSIHLTNVALQKHTDEYNTETGGKWDLRDMKLYLMTKHGREVVNKCFLDIQMLVIRSLICVQPVMINDKHCFELYGYDVLLDEDLRPWLIEVNASPSLTANTPSDYKMKFNMLNDVMDIVDMERLNEGNEERIGGFDLIYSKDSVITPRSNLLSYLGCDIPPKEKRKKKKKTSGDKESKESTTGRGSSSRFRRNVSSRRDSSKVKGSTSSLKSSRARRKKASSQQSRSNRSDGEE